MYTVRYEVASLVDDYPQAVSCEERTFAWLTEALYDMRSHANVFVDQPGWTITYDASACVVIDAIPIVCDGRTYGERLFWSIRGERTAA